MRVGINKATKGLDLFEKGTKIKSLTQEGTNRFLQDLNYEMYQKGHILEEQEEIKIGDILGSVEGDESESFNQLESIDIGIIAYYKCFPSAILETKKKTILKLNLKINRKSMQKEKHPLGGVFLDFIQ